MGHCGDAFWVGLGSFIGFLGVLQFLVFGIVKKCLTLWDKSVKS